MAFTLRMFNGGKARVENEHGQPVVDEAGKPIEVDAPQAEPLASQLGVGDAIKDDPQVAALQAKVAELEQALIENAAAQAAQAAQRIDAAARALADELVRDGKLLPADASVLATTYKLAATHDPTLGEEVAAFFRKREPHALYGERVATPPAAPIIPAAGLSAPVPVRSGAPAVAVVERVPVTALDPTQGTESVRPVPNGLDTASLMALLESTEGGNAIIAKLKRKEIDWEQTAAPLQKVFATHHA